MPAIYFPSAFSLPPVRTEMITGYLAAFCGVMGVAGLAAALLAYSPPL